MIKRITAEWSSLPDAVTKPIRDFAVAFAGLLIATGAMDGGNPDWKMLWPAIVMSASNALWRTGRAQAVKAGVT